LKACFQKRNEITKTVMSEANERPFLFVGSPRGSLEEPATTAIPLLQHPAVAGTGSLVLQLSAQSSADVTAVIGL